MRKLRHRLRSDIKRRHHRGRAPVLGCTPDGLEALSVGDRAIVLIDGTVEQIGTSDQIWNTPRTTRVAKLIGDPPMNLLSGKVTAVNGAASLETGSVAIPLGTEARSRARSSMRLTIGVRADALCLTEASAKDSLPAEIYAVEPFGKWAIVTARLAGELVKLKVAELPHLAPGDAVGLTVRDWKWTLFDGVTGVALPDN